MNRHVHNVFMYCQRAFRNMLYLYSKCSLVIINNVTSSFDLLFPSDVDENKGVIVQHNRATRSAIGTLDYSDCKTALIHRYLRERA